jgi:hypothetical protein
MAPEALGIAVFAIVAGPMLWPRGVVIKSEEQRLNGILTTYERVSGLRALRHWRDGSLLSEASVHGKDADAASGS